MVTVEGSGNQQFTNDLIITKGKVVVICVGEINPRKGGDTDMSAVSAADSSQVSFTTHRSVIRDGGLLLLESCVCVCVCVCVVGGLVVGGLVVGVLASSWLLLFTVQSMCDGSILPVIRMLSI